MTTLDNKEVTQVQEFLAGVGVTAGAVGLYMAGAPFKTESILVLVGMGAVLYTDAISLMIDVGGAAVTGSVIGPLGLYGIVGAGAGAAAYMTDSNVTMAAAWAVGVLFVEWNVLRLTMKQFNPLGTGGGVIL